MKKTTLFLLIFSLMPINAMSETIKFVTDEYPPYNYAENGKAKGICIDVVTEICRRLGYDANFMVVSWPRAIKSVNEGTADGIFYLYYNKEREKFLYFPSEPIANPRNICLVRKASNIKIEKLEDLKNKVVGVIESYSYGTEFDNLHDVRKRSYQDIRELVRIIHIGRADMVAAAELPFKFASKNKNLDFEEEFRIAYVITQDPVYIGFSRAAGEKGKIWAEKFSDMLRQLKEEGFIDKITNNYF